MSETDCTTWEAAIVEHHGVAVVWVTTPPEVNVSNELLEDSAAREFIESKYELAEPCPVFPGCRHARLASPTPNGEPA